MTSLMVAMRKNAYLGQTLVRPLLCFYFPLLASEVACFIQMKEESVMDLAQGVRSACAALVVCMAFGMPLLLRHLQPEILLKEDRLPNFLLLAPHLFSLPILLTRCKDVGPSTTILCAGLVSFDLPVSFRTACVLPLLGALTCGWTAPLDGILLFLIGVAFRASRMLEASHESSTRKSKEAFSILPEPSPSHHSLAKEEDLEQAPGTKNYQEDKVNAAFLDKNTLNASGVMLNQNSTTNTEEQTRARLSSGFMQSGGLDRQSSPATDERARLSGGFMPSGLSRTADTGSGVGTVRARLEGNYDRLGSVQGLDFKAAGISSSVDPDERADVVYQDGPDEALMIGIPGSPFSRPRGCSEYSNISGGSSPPPAARPRGISEGSEWSVNTLTYSVSVPSSSPSFGNMLKTDSACQTTVVWKDTNWHCTQCARPPLPQRDLRQTPSKASSFAGVDPKWARECKNKANEFVEQLQGEWRLQCSSAGHKDLVADWLSAFSIDGHDVTSQDGTEQQLEIITEMKVCLCGGELKLDNLGNLHRHGRSGQHLVFSPCEEMSQEQESSRSHRELS
ncbi:unnamed protein product [Durusdinium trenchii]|uniref:Uncharacterized protein n=1 Tax=Durusdinium trenchii TaxID=1381693 RepID=A0ABP0MLW5_9DINO